MSSTQCGQRVLITGAAGRLGRAVSSLFHREGVDIVTTDIVDVGSVPYRFEQADLLDHTAVAALLEGLDVVVHLGNHPGIGSEPPQIVFNQNVSMNENVFQGAAERGVAKIVFASTLQLIGSHVDARTVVTAARPPSFPLTGHTVADPSNVYALSKTVSETMLRYYAERCGLSGTALRFPLLLKHGDDRFAVATGEERSIDIFEGFTGLTYEDAAALVLAVVRSDLPGYRAYLPGTAHRHRDLDLPELIRTFYPHLADDLDDLIDNSEILEETGWRHGPGYRRDEH